MAERERNYSNTSRSFHAANGPIQTTIPSHSHSPLFSAMLNDAWCSCCLLAIDPSLASLLLPMILHPIPFLYLLFLFPFIVFFPFPFSFSFSTSSPPFPSLCPYPLVLPTNPSTGQKKCFFDVCQATFPLPPFSPLPSLKFIPIQ